MSSLTPVDYEESASPPAASPLPDEVQQAIPRAKQDWGSTADPLPHIVCLLDERRQAVRVNRVIEAWQLGRVNDVTGRDMHDLLHPGGCERDCILGSLLEDAWIRMQSGASVEFETLDSRLDRAGSGA